jgi:methylsterol monooxygenase
MVRLSLFSAASGLFLSSFSSASPVSVVQESKTTSDLVKRRCGFETWDSTNINNWFEAGTDAWFEAWWLRYLGGNGPDTSAVIPNGWPNNFVRIDHNVSRISILISKGQSFRQNVLGWRKFVFRNMK